VQIYVIETNYFPMLHLHRGISFYATVVENTTHCFFPIRKDALQRKSKLSFYILNGMMDWNF